MNDWSETGGQKAKINGPTGSPRLSEYQIKQIAKDIIEHFEQRQALFEGKGMIVTMSRRIAFFFRQS
ncbi:MAG: hypothetical protein IPH88_18675 [Bacteroidales bacterium]|nr:hypothetical protein [Bacteroidales bacterium]